MIRMTLLLCAAIYVVMIVFSDTERPQPGSVEMARAGFDPTAVAASQAAASPAPAAGPDAALTIPGPEGAPIAVSDVIDPSEMRGGVIRLAQAATPQEVIEGAQETADAEALSPDTRYVTGSRVNMRSGPSTGNPVLAVLPEGAEVSMIAETGTGWTEIRLPETGQTGFMSSRYLSADRP